jgi:hypothetical protein
MGYLLGQLDQRLELQIQEVGPIGQVRLGTHGSLIPVHTIKVIATVQAQEDSQHQLLESTGLRTTRMLRNTQLPPIPLTTIRIL